MSISEKEITFLAGLVRRAGELDIMPRFRNLASRDIAQKTSSIDLVTEADLLAEKRITQALRERFPTALIVGEEAYEADKSVVPALADAELAFVIDPVDGTYNFASGLPVFGTILAVVVRGETVAGIIHDPVLGDTLTSIRGGLLVADVRVGWVRAKAIIDTGAQGTVGNLMLRNALMRHPPRNAAHEDIIGVTLDVQGGDNIQAPDIDFGHLSVHGVRVTFGDMYLFQHWKLTDEPTLTLGMDLLGSFDVLIIDYNRHELQIRLRGSKLPD